MAKVNVQVTGGTIQQKDAETVSDLKRMLNVDSYQATVNGDPVDDDYELTDYEHVALTPKVKGA